VTLRDKVRICEILKTRMWSQFSSESRDPSYVGQAMCPECPTKGWQGESFWLRPRESGPEATLPRGKASMKMNEEEL